MAKVYRIQAYDSLMCGYFCIGYFDLMTKGKQIRFIRVYKFSFS